MPSSPNRTYTRREALRLGLRAGGVIALGGIGLTALPPLSRDDNSERVWQIDPDRCIQCGNCATYCVLDTSAVRCVHDPSTCGYCNLCFGYFNPRTSTDEPPGVNGQCPTDAIRRTQVEDPYFEYRIEQDKCIGCGICVKGCQDSGNGSLRLQILQDLCVHCNQCAIASACPASAIRRVSARTPYLKRGGGPP